MKTIKLILATAIIANIFTACSSAADKEADKNITIVKALRKGYAYDGKQISITGTLALSNYVVTIREGQQIDVNLTATVADATSYEKEAIGGIKLDYGKGKNNSAFINVPESATKFDDKDVVFTDNKGNTFTGKDKVTITGLVTYTDKGPKKIDSKNIAAKMADDMAKKKPDYDPNDYSFTITNVTIEKIIPAAEKK